MSRPSDHRKLRREIARLQSDGPTALDRNPDGEIESEIEGLSNPDGLTMRQCNHLAALDPDDGPTGAEIYAEEQERARKRRENAETGEEIEHRNDPTRIVPFNAAEKSLETGDGLTNRWGQNRDRE